MSYQNTVILTNYLMTVYEIEASKSIRTVEPDEEASRLYKDTHFTISHCEVVQVLVLILS